MVTMRVRLSSVELLRGDAMNVGRWTINREFVEIMCVGERVLETNEDQSTNHNERNVN